jgi:hypothetical protein
MREMQRGQVDLEIQRGCQRRKGAALNVIKLSLTDFLPICCVARPTPEFGLLGIACSPKAVFSVLCRLVVACALQILAPLETTQT